mmetsp:Transcript_16695/g.54358  ORF Transcript_16695/g.54358 Transcript_16695/m.54358 type:complete len:149 (-) Transcript_16695:79-525(-)
MVARYWRPLTSISTDPESLLPLCKLFERLLLDASPRLFYHLVRDVGVQPLAVAAEWIVLAFVTVLDVDQVLLLWDRVIGFDTNLVLPVLAAAIFLFRSEQLMTAQTPDDVHDMFSDCSTLAVVPLLQLFLWPCAPPAPGAGASSSSFD